MAHRFRFVLILIVLTGTLGGFLLPEPAMACGYVKCEDPGVDDCWSCTYSLYLFQRCRYWCRESPTGAMHSTCWEEECYSPVSIEDRSSELQLATLGLMGGGQCASTQGELGMDRPAEIDSTKETRQIVAIRPNPRS